MNVSGRVIDKKGEPVYGAKVFLSDISGNITASKIGAITDFDGKFNLKLPQNVDGTHLTATTTDGGRKTNVLNPSVDKYEFDLTYSREQNLPEVVVVGTRPKQEEEKKKPKIEVDTSKYKKWLKIGLISLASLVVIGTTIYVIRKNK
jgi:hypothetical protein